MEHETLATELLRELKSTSRRWFIAFIVMVILEAATIFAFIWYITLPVEEYSVEQLANDRSVNLFNSGGGEYGGLSKGVLSETGDAE